MLLYVPDTFTDSAISKSHNGQTSEKELTPWEGDPNLDIDLDGGEASVNNIILNFYCTF